MAACMCSRPYSAAKPLPYPLAAAPSPSKLPDEVVDMMRYVVTNGTGRNAAVKGYELMGKTGTAEKLVNGVYEKKRLVTSFVAGFPHSDPNYVVFVVFDEPKAYAGSYGYATAGWNAAKTAGAVVERIAPVLGVKKAVTKTMVSASGAASAGEGSNEAFQSSTGLG